jgi:hypothetical protein
MRLQCSDSCRRALQPAQPQGPPSLASLPFTHLTPTQTCPPACLRAGGGALRAAQPQGGSPLPGSHHNHPGECTHAGKKGGRSSAGRLRSGGGCSVQAPHPPRRCCQLSMHFARTAKHLQHRLSFLYHGACFDRCCACCACRASLTTTSCWPSPRLPSRATCAATQTSSSASRWVGGWARGWARGWAHGWARGWHRVPVRG